jgi:rod shape-determining protein MreD
MTFVLYLSGVFLLLVEMVTPAFSPRLTLHVALVCLPIFYAVFYMGTSRALVLATALGLTLDLLSPPAPGVSVVTLGITVGLLASQRRLVRSEGGLFTILLGLLATFFYLALDYLIFSARLGRWYWPLDLSVRLVVESILNALLLIPYTVLIHSLQKMWHGEKWRRRYLNYADT